MPQALLAELTERALAAMTSGQEDRLWFGTTLCFIAALLTIIISSA
jgi:hypothetical protein